MAKLAKIGRVTVRKAVAREIPDPIFWDDEAPAWDDEAPDLSAIRNFTGTREFRRDWLANLDAGNW